MGFKEFLLLLSSIFASGFGQFFLKKGALDLGEVTFNNMIDHVTRIILTPNLVIGLGCYGLGAITYILVLTRVPLSVVGPSSSLIYIISVMLGYFYFNETIGLTRSIGLGVIICGVILVVYQK